MLTGCGTWGRSLERSGGDLRLWGGACQLFWSKDLSRAKLGVPSVVQNTSRFIVSNRELQNETRLGLKGEWTKQTSPTGLIVMRFTPLLAFVALCWLVFGLNNLFWDGQLNQHGIIPRRVGGLAGIVWAPFLHGSSRHLTANTVPLVILGAIVCARGRSEFPLVAVAGTLFTGALTWLFARNGSHIGASGLVFCFFGYLTSTAWFSRTFGALILSAICLFAYGGLLRGVLPGSSEISWEGHVAGLAAGIVLAWLCIKLKATPAGRQPFTYDR